MFLHISAAVLGTEHDAALSKPVGSWAFGLSSPAAPALHPASPDAVTGTCRAAEQQPGCKPLTALQWPGHINQKYIFSWWLGFLWAYASWGTMCSYFFSIKKKKKDTNKQILVLVNFWNTDISLEHETQNCMWLLFLQLSWSLASPTNLHFEHSAWSLTFLLSEMMEGLKNCPLLHSQLCDTGTALGKPCLLKGWVLMEGDVFLVEGSYRCKWNVEGFLYREGSLVFHWICKLLSIIKKIQRWSQNLSFA